MRFVHDLFELSRTPTRAAIHLHGCEALDVAAVLGILGRWCISSHRLSGELSGRLRCSQSRFRRRGGGLASGEPGEAKAWKDLAVRLQTISDRRRVVRSLRGEINIFGLGRGGPTEPSCSQIVAFWVGKTPTIPLAAFPHVLFIQPPTAVPSTSPPPPTPTPTSTRPARLPRRSPTCHPYDAAIPASPQKTTLASTTARSTPRLENTFLAHGTRGSSTARTGSRSYAQPTQSALR